MITIDRSGDYDNNKPPRLLHSLGGYYCWLARLLYIELGFTDYLGDRFSSVHGTIPFLHNF